MKFKKYTRKNIRKVVKSLVRKLFLFMAKDLVINKYEVVIFPKDFPSSTDFNALLEEIKQEITMFKNSVNIVIPAPPNAPPDIPRVLLRNKDNSIGCNISVNKVNMFWLNSKELSDYVVTLGDIKNFVDKLSQIILKHTPTKEINRIGYIKEIFFVSDKPIEDIQKNIIKTDITKNLREFIFQLTYDLTLTIEETTISCNEFIVLGKGQKQTSNKEPVIMLTKDINTLASEKINWKIDKIKKFIEKADEKANKQDIYNSFFNGDEQ